MQKFSDKKDKELLLPEINVKFVVEGFSFFVPVSGAFKGENCSVLSFHTNEI
jgi:hypothetical protein